MIARETIEEIQARLNIADVVSGYVSLKKAGINFVGLCPFHPEKHPSFTVSPSKGMFYCFGCKKGGGIFQFIQEIENVSFAEAVEILAQKAGVEVRYTSKVSGQGTKKHLYEFMQWAASTYNMWLKGSFEAKGALAYLYKRKLKDEIIDRFLIGYAPAEGDAFYKKARESGFDESCILESGLVRQREDKSMCDYFRGRITIPIFDSRGRVIAFGARVLDDSQPKYINSPETILFSKSQTLYGLHLISRSSKAIYIVEGYFDVIMPYQYNVQGLVATMGTALSESHIRILRRYANKIVLVYDADEAGQKASERGLDILLKENIDVGICRLPAGNDPCDFVVNNGKEAFESYIEKPIDLFDFLIENITTRYDMKTAYGQIQAAREVRERISIIPDGKKRELLIGRASKYIPRHILVSEASVQIPVRMQTRKELNEEEMLAIDLMKFMLAQNEWIPYIKEKVDIQALPPSDIWKLFKQIISIYEQNEKVEINDLTFDIQNDKIYKFMAKISFEKIEEKEVTKWLDSLIRRMQDLQDKMKKADFKWR